MVDLDEGSVGVLLAHHLTPQLGRLRLRDLRPGHVEAMLRAVKAGPSTRRRVHATLRSALSDAKRRRLVPYNAAVDAAVPAASRPKVRPWEPAELGRFLDAVASHRLDALRDGDPVQGDGAAAGGALRGGRPRPCCLTRGAAG
jgi:hypothetical protein